MQGKQDVDDEENDAANTKNDNNDIFDDNFVQEI